MVSGVLRRQIWRVFAVLPEAKLARRRRELFGVFSNGFMRYRALGAS